MKTKHLSPHLLGVRAKPPCVLVALPQWCLSAPPLTLSVSLLRHTHARIQDTGAVCAFGPGTFPDLMSTDQHQLNRHTRRLAPSVMYHDLRGGQRGGVMILVSYAVHVTAQMEGTDEKLTVTLPITIVDAVM